MSRNSKSAKDCCMDISAYSDEMGRTELNGLPSVKDMLRDAPSSKER
jgi:hypothetical protein